MFGYSKKEFVGLITRLENEVALVEVRDAIGEKSYMDIPKKYLKKKNIEFWAGVVFSITLKCWLKWDWLVFSPIKQEPMTKEEFDALLKHYEEKYGDV